MDNEEIIAEINAAAEADDPEFREVCTLASLVELSDEIAALALDLGAELPEWLMEGVDDGDATDYTDALTVILRHIRGQIDG